MLAYINGSVTCIHTSHVCPFKAKNIYNSQIIVQAKKMMNGVSDLTRLESLSMRGNRDILCPFSSHIYAR